MVDCEIHDIAVIEAERLTKRVAELEAKVRAWEYWYEGVVADFVGLTTDASDPQRLHDWQWMDDHRPAPTKL